MVILTVTGTKFGKDEPSITVEGETRNAAIAGWISDYADRRVDTDALITMLFTHDDLTITTPTWSMRFLQTFHP